MQKHKGSIVLNRVFGEGVILKKSGWIISRYKRAGDKIPTLSIRIYRENRTERPAEAEWKISS